jgi:small subunit ribosomal protein S30e
MQIFVHSQARHVVDVDAAFTVDAVKATIASLEGLPVDSMYLTCGGRPVEAGSLVDNGVMDMSTLEVGVRMLGGKVHGSLARAGKVKGQTPKIEKQEKKKEKTGKRARQALFRGGAGGMAVAVWKRAP